MLLETRKSRDKSGNDMRNDYNYRKSFNEGNKYNPDRRELFGGLRNNNGTILLPATFKNEEGEKEIDQNSTFTITTIKIL